MFAAASYNSAFAIAETLGKYIYSFLIWSFWILMSLLRSWCSYCNQLWWQGSCSHWCDCCQAPGSNADEHAVSWNVYFNGFRFYNIFSRYKVRLPDHDFSVGARHLLTPSVVAICRTIGGKVSFSGETYVAIRSQKHNNSSAYSHQEDMSRVINLFPEASMIDGKVKLVIIKGLWFLIIHII